MKKLLLTITLLGLLLAPVVLFAQNGTTPPPNLSAITNGSSLFANALDLIPQADLSITNGPASFQGGELEFEASGVFHTLNAVGVSPYVSLGANYWLTKNLGLGGEIITLNNGTGTSVADASSAYFLLRKPMGNLAGYLLTGFYRDFNLGENYARVGAGIEYRYNTGLGAFVDSSYLASFHSAGQNDWLTRIGATLHF